VIAAVPPVSSWYDSYSGWLNRTASPYRASLVDGRAPNQTAFYAWLNEWLAKDGKSFQDSILFNATTGRIIGSKFSAFTKASPARQTTHGPYKIELARSGAYSNCRTASPSVPPSPSVAPCLQAPPYRAYGALFPSLPRQDVVDGDFAIRIVDSTRWTVANAAPSLQVRTPST
jgi:hypothetical protein